MEKLNSFPTIILEKIFGTEVSDYLVMLYIVMVSSLIIFFFLTRKLSLKNPKPSQQILEIGVESLERLLEEIIGKKGKDYLAPLGTFGVLIFFSNLSGFIPGFMPPTATLLVTISLGLCSFITYNFIGLYKGGFSYIKHFLGPIAALAIIFVPVELASHLSRPFSLGVRLFCNIFGDHQVGHIFLKLAPLGIPVPFILLGLFVAFMQTFIFVLLSAVYIAMALPHEEENH